ncbi:hypothetical protein LG634_15325 [Streptomyces bambusae]|uniref:hypothetical protein n=1 Tax=Streptomyces bambusae TaxID=1550616 RepID=UPI001CFD006C|nr:hypothetical protein [Streptomyces bambusae]MCB5166199.1 hypothetical protein [Streptomyces bambusae]
MSDQNTTDVAEPAVAEPVAEPVAEAVAGPAGPVATAKPPRDRRILRAALRWTAAVLVFGAAGSGVAYGIGERERTDLPGLGTLADGRWPYPELVKPPVPAGAPLPFAEDNEANVHYADLGGLLLPAPAGAEPGRLARAKADKGRADVSQEVTLGQLLSEYAADERAATRQSLVDEGVRHVAARGWTMPDGTRTRIYLIRFPGEQAAAAWTGCARQMTLAGTEELQLDLAWTETKSDQNFVTRNTDVEIGVYEESAPTGPEHARAACIQAGDVQALIVARRSGGVPMVPFHQTVVLQNQLLG